MKKIPVYESKDVNWGMTPNEIVDNVFDIIQEKEYKRLRVAKANDRVYRFVLRNILKEGLDELSVEFTDKSFEEYYELFKDKFNSSILGSAIKRSSNAKIIE